MDWPSFSPDIIPWDYFLWRHIVFPQQSYNVLRDRRRLICHACVSISADRLFVMLVCRFRPATTFCGGTLTDIVLPQQSYNFIRDRWRLFVKLVCRFPLTDYREYLTFSFFVCGMCVVRKEGTHFQSLWCECN